MHKYATLRTDESDINVVYVCLAAQETVGTDVCYKPSITVAARAGRDINREFIIVDCNGVAQFVELNGQHANNALIQENAWIRSRFYLIMEVKMVKHVATAVNENVKTTVSSMQGAQTRCPREQKLKGRAVIPPCSSGGST